MPDSDALNFAASGNAAAIAGLSIGSFHSRDFPQLTPPCAVREAGFPCLSPEPGARGIALIVTGRARNAKTGSVAMPKENGARGVQARNSFLLRATLQKSGSTQRSRSFAMMGVSRPSELSGRTKPIPPKDQFRTSHLLQGTMLGKAVGDVIMARKDEAEITSSVWLRGCRATAPANARLKCGSAWRRPKPFSGQGPKPAPRGIAHRGEPRPHIGEPVQGHQPGLDHL